MDEQGKSSQNLPNTIPITDGWYLRDSKSNPGRKYYFNPLTKQSFWHITDDEIKLLEKKTNNIKDQSNSTGDNSDKKPSGSQTVLEQAPPRETATNNIMHPINLLKGALPFDPSVWTIPPTPQLLPTAVVNFPNTLVRPPTQTTVIITQNDLQSRTAYDTHQMLNINRFPPDVVNNSYQSVRTRNISNRNFPRKRHNDRDLRNDLRTKRLNTNYSSSRRINIRNDSFDNIIWDEDTVNHVLIFLNQKAAPNTKDDCWYIVTDTNVVINHSLLLNMMTNLDVVKKCCLKVPPMVKMKLKTIAQQPGNEPIRRFLRFHCTETDPERQVENENDETLSILKTCRELTEDNYHVVLLCQDVDFHKFKNFLANPVFTIPKLISCIKNGHSKYFNPRISVKPQEAVLSHDMTLDTKYENEKKSSIAIENLLENSFLSEISNTEVQNKREINEECEIKSEPKVNVASNTCLPETKVIKTDKSAQKSHDSNSSSSSAHNLDSSNAAKKRIIKLKQICNQNPLSSQISVKKKRWSAMRNINKDHEQTSKTFPSNNNNEDTNNLETTKNTKLELHEGQNEAISNKNLIDNGPFPIFTSNSATDIDQDKSNFKDKHASITTTTTRDIVNTDEPKTVNERFMDIVENVLLQVLPQESTTIINKVPQFQRLHKETLQIISKYSHCYNVVDKANKFSKKLKQLSDSEDDVNFNKTAFEDADIYILGVNFVDSLQEISHNVENIRIARTLLKNLYREARVSNPDVADQIQENSIEDNQECSTKDDASIVYALMPVLETTPDEENNSEIECDVNNVRVQKRKSSEAAEYFIALKLRRKETNKLISNEDNNVLSTADDCVKNESELGNDISKTPCSESIGDDVEIIESDYDKSIDIDCKEGIIEPQDFFNVNETSDVSRVNNVDNEKFKFFIGMFLKEIRETFLVCAQNFESCLIRENGDDYVANDKFNEINAILRNIRQSLDSIIERESGDVNNSFKSLLSNAGIDIDIDSNMCDEYRDIVHKCRDEVNGFSKIIQNIMT